MANKQYSNEEIYHNEKVSTVLSVISLFIAIILMIIEVIYRVVVNEETAIEGAVILNLIRIGVPALNLIPCYNLMDLDEETEERIIKIFKDLVDKGKCVIVVTHSKKVAQNADVIYRIKGGDIYIESK